MMVASCLQKIESRCQRLGLQDIDCDLGPVVLHMWLLQVNEELSRFIYKPPGVGSETAILSAAHVRWMWHTAAKRLRDSFPLFLLSIPSIHSLPEAWGCWEPQFVPPALHYGCIMPIPSSQLQQKNQSHAEKQRVLSRSCGLQDLLQYTYCAPMWLPTKLLATVGWKRGCQPFCCRCSQNVTHYRKEICSTCLSKESISGNPFWNFKHPLPARSRFLRATVRFTSSGLWLYHAHPFVAAAERNHVPCRAAEGLVAELWSPRFVSRQWWCSHFCYVTAANQWTFVETEPFSNSGLEVGLPAFQLLFAECDTLAKRDLFDIFV